MTKIKKSELKSHLLQSIQILKRDLDYTTYSYFILAVLFFYHASEMPGLYSGKLNLPRVVSSSSVPVRIGFQRKKRDLQDELTSAFSDFESTSPLLRNLLLPSIPDSSISDADLIAYREQLEQLQQRTGIFSSTQNFSRAYDYWISQLAKLTIKQGVSFYTPRSVIQLMVGMMKPTSGMSIYDPTVGTGGMFTESAHYINQHGGDVSLVEFYGCEMASDIWAICTMNILAHRLAHAVINQGDALKNPLELLGKFDLVLQNLPLPTDASQKGQVRRINDDFLRHALEVMASNGRGAILTPSTLLQEDHRDFWRQIIGRDWLEAVISLPAKLLHGTNSSATILVLNKKKPDTRVGSVLFVQASNEALPYARHNELEDAIIHSVIQSFEEWKNIPDYARIVSTKRIEDYDYKLSVDKYLSLEDEAQTFDIMSALKRYHSAVQEREAAVDKLMKSLEALNYSVKPLESNDPTV